MTEHAGNHEPAIRIDPVREEEFTYWGEKLGVPAQRIREAVQAVGPVLVDVQRYLGHPVSPHPPLNAPGRGSA